MTSADAAATLGVSRREVQRLSQTGALAVVGTVGQALLLDPISVHRHAGHTVKLGRPWSVRTAWSAIDLLDGGSGGLLDAAGRRHLRAKLGHLSIDDFVWLARRRANEEHYRGWRGQYEQLRAAIIATGASTEPVPLAAHFNLSPDLDRVGGYVPVTELPELVRRFELVPSPAGPVTLLVVDPAGSALVQSSAVLTALDLASSIDPRERSAGRRVLGEYLTRFRP